jgi:predicted RNase H-like HicB family nuclease
MKLTAVFEPAKESGYTCFVEEIPAAISQGETMEEAKANLADALKLVLQCRRELAEPALFFPPTMDTVSLSSRQIDRIIKAARTQEKIGRKRRPKE